MMLEPVKLAWELLLTKTPWPWLPETTRLPPRSLKVEGMKQISGRGPGARRRIGLEAFERRCRLKRPALSLAERRDL